MTSSSSAASVESPPPFPTLLDKRIILGCGGLGLDYLATVKAFPKPDDKIRSTNSMVQGGDNAGNALTCAARLGLTRRLISKIADDAPGRSILAELEADGVDTSYIVVSEEGNSPFTYIIVDNQMKTRTYIHTPGHPAMVPDDLSRSRLLSALNGARLFYSDVRLHETALVIAKEAARMQIPILIDCERKREGLDDLLNMPDYVVCSARFPQAWTEAPSIASALLAMLVQLPQIKFVIVTLGEDGCIMLERNINVMQLNSSGIGTVSGKLLVGTAEAIPSSELVGTTGAGDAFIGAILYGICADMPPEKMLPFAAQVAAAGCRALGARTGLPRGTDPHLAPFLL